MLWTGEWAPPLYMITVPHQCWRVVNLGRLFTASSIYNRHSPVEEWHRIGFQVMEEPAYLHSVPDLPVFSLANDQKNMRCHERQSEAFPCAIRMPFDMVGSIWL